MVSGDCVEGTIDKFTLNGLFPICLSRIHIEFIPEQVEKTAVALGAELALCINNKCILHYTGSIDERELEMLEPTKI